MTNTTPEEVIPFLREALDYQGPYLLDFRIEREENVFPMVPAVLVHHEMILQKPKFFNFLPIYVT